jgi:hypothetical protein
MEQVVMDYYNKRKVGAVGNLAARGVLAAASLLTVYGLYKFNTRDVGITEFIHQLWKGPAASHPTAPASHDKAEKVKHH